jgi:tryptophanyl-tRNA synthetase
MSKSASNPFGTIFLLDNPKLAEKKIMAAKTDSFNKINFDRINQPGISNLIIIMHCLTNKPIDKIVAEYKKIKNYGIFKSDICVELKKFLNKFQKKYYNFITKEKKIEDILKINKIKCISIAQKMINKVYLKLGIL